MKRIRTLCFLAVVAALVACGGSSGVPEQTLQSLNEAQIKALSTAQVAAFTRAQIAVLTPLQISYITPDAFGGLSEGALVSLSPAQVSALTPAQAAKLTAVQIDALTPEQIVSFSTEALSNMPPVSAFKGLQGIWRDPAGAARELSALTLPDGKIWFLDRSANTTRVIKGDFEVKGSTFQSNGRSFILGTTTVTSSNLLAAVVKKSSLSLTVSAGSQSENFNLIYQPRYDTAATLADFSGSWRGSLVGYTVSWLLTPSGLLSGSSSAGCTYDGELNLRAEQKATVNVRVTENCAGALVQLSGVAVKTEDKTGVTLIFTNADDSAAVAINLRPPL